MARADANSRARASALAVHPNTRLVGFQRRCDVRSDGGWIT